jgi:3-hydroxyisobutyrate dehydrogenase-like beta-hydroxyacid dehydrogenase
MKTLGIIGTGGMGGGMVANLIKAGHRLVVNNLRREVARPLESQGAEFKEAPRTVADGESIQVSTRSRPTMLRAR